MLRFLVAAAPLLFLPPAVAGKEAVASAHPLATAAGRAVLAQGGNAFDAAVAVAATLAVVEPYSSGLGGGGFWLLHRARDGREVMVDARETAPLAARQDMYLDAAGKPVAGASLKGPRAAAIPGTPAALSWVAERYGRLPLSVSLAPAIRYAEEGFPVDERFARIAAEKAQLLRADPTAAGIFLRDGVPPRVGERLSQPALAMTLRAIARDGHDGFYSGPVAEMLVRSVREAGGLWTMEDLRRYRIVEREPVRIRYRGATITTAALPSAGGLTLAQALHVLERFPLERLSEADQAHLVVEALRRAYQDRARFLGDPDFVSGPWERLASRDYAAQRARSIDLQRATPSAELPGLEMKEGGSTTHFSIVDKEGNRVAATLTLNTLFGSGFVAGASGVLLNNEMDDFALAPGVPNVYGLVGGRANAIAPGKRPLSSMSPTFVENAKGVLVIGTPGGSRIISMVLLAILQYLHADDPDPVRIVAAPRYHHQYLPDRIELEPGAFPAAWRAALEAKGHLLREAPRPWGNMQAVFVDRATGDAVAASDPRGTAGAAWY
ncbi:gamma-glutamyltransferase [Pelomicrobium methylotrophicum]|uniref:Glutathione hydrolase proenzyme n=1 Tax=Pelomicrobium methylotrophicum TaxID=2602750 RepID=A0A5C7ET42_9PROT|nr:gamma-glutamyltransferase [Pelomicrobium methylotrophicum]TXF11060.1 gamma-glutamyltransferase [Pelomicrobium methylotrophicum]